MKRILIAIFIALGLFSTQGFTQLSKLKSANAAYQKLSYPQAVREYETFLGSSAAKGKLRKDALSNLAYSYRKLQDFKNAERVYKDLFKAFEAELSSDQVLYYAQALANNGKYRESQKYYSKYGALQKDDLRGKNYTIAYMDNSYLFNDSKLYKVNYLENVNSKYSDFSPMYYDNSLVFVSARNEGSGIKRIFKQNETPFLDLFVFSDTSAILGTPVLDKQQPQASLGSSGKSEKTPVKNDNSKSLNLEDTNIDEFSKTINTKYHEGPMTFYKDYSKIIFTRNNYNKGKAKKSEKGINMLKLYTANKKGEKWEDVEELPFNSDEYSTGHPALSPDNLKLYFVSDMSGGFGGTDIYVVENHNGTWGTPVNLGREINTEGNEMFPFMDDIGNLYFASDGHVGLGGLDIFYCEFRNGSPMGVVENLGDPINSPQDDFGIIANGLRNEGYFSSNRKKGYSDDNIYSFTKGCNQLQILVYDAKTNQPLDSTELRLVKNGVNKQMYLTDADGAAEVCLESGVDFEFKAFKEGYEIGAVSYGTMSGSIAKQQKVTMYLHKSKRQILKGKVISEVDQLPLPGATVTLENQRDGSIDTVITGPDGRYAFQPEKDGKYVVQAIKENYAKNKEENVKIKSSSKINTVEKDFGMIGEGNVFKLDNIYYDYAKSAIRPDAQRELESKLIPILKKYPGVRIEIGSHTDSRATFEHNVKLSEERSKQVVEYLIKKSIDSDRLEAKGYGERVLVNNCDDSSACSEADHQKNRRTEFKIIAVEEFLGARW